MLFVRGKLIDPDQPPSGDNDGGGGSGSDSENTGGGSGSDSENTGGDSGSEESTADNLYLVSSTYENGVYTTKWSTTNTDALYFFYINHLQGADYYASTYNDGIDGLFTIEIDETLIDDTDGKLYISKEFDRYSEYVYNLAELDLNAFMNNDDVYIDAAKENGLAFNIESMVHSSKEEPVEPVEPISWSRQLIAVPSGNYGNFDRASILELYDDTTGDFTYHVISEKSHYLLDVLNNKLTLLDTNDDYFTKYLSDTNRCHVAIGNKIYWAYQNDSGFVSIRSWDAENGINTSFMTNTELGGIGGCSCVCTDGTYMYIHSYVKKTLYRIDVDTKEVTGLVSSELTLRQMVYSPHSQCIYCYCKDGKLYEYSLDREKLTALCDIPNFLDTMGVFEYQGSIYLIGGQGSGTDAVIQQYVRKYSISDDTIEVIKTDAPKAYKRLYFIPSSYNLLYSIGNDDNKGLYYEGILN